MEDFTIKEFHDFVRILEDRPEWREELRRLLLTDELLRLPELVRELIEAQRRTEERPETLTARLDGLTARVDALVEAQRRTKETVRGLIRDVGELKGRSLETDYRDRSFAYFGRLVKRSHTLSPDEVSELVGRGRRGNYLEREVYLAVEVSWSLGVGDVERAGRRAKILGKLGVRALPVVAGNGIAEEADSAAREMGIYRVIDGKLLS